MEVIFYTLINNTMNLADKTALNVLAKSSEVFWLLISSIVMVRNFSKAEYGTFLQIMLIANTMTMFTFLGLPQSIFYFFPRALNRRKFVIRNVLLSLSIALIASLIVYIFKNELANWLSNPLLVEYGWVAPLLLLLRAPSSIKEPMLISHGSLILNSVITLFYSTTFFVPLIIASLLSVSLSTFLKVMISASGVNLCIYLGSMTWVLYRSDESSLSESARDLSQNEVSFKAQFKYSLPIGVSSYMGIVGRQIDQFIVSAFFTPRDFALYSRGAMKIPVLSDIQVTINSIMKPQYVRAYQVGDIKALLNIFHLCIEKVAKINFAVFSLLFAVTPSIIRFLYTEEYLEASPIFRVYLCLLIIDITAYSVILNSAGKTFYSIYINAISISTNIILSLLLILVLGPIGAAVATIISRIIVILFILFQSCKILGVSFAAIFPWKYLAQLLVIALVASVPVYCIELFFYTKGGIQFLVLIVEGLLYMYFYAFFMMKKGLIYQDDMELLKKWLRFDVERFLYKISWLSPNRK